MTKMKVRILTILLILGGFFVWPKLCFGQELTIVINEIAAYKKTDYEWLEILNVSTEAVDLDGWKFYEYETNHRLNLFQGEDMIIEPEEYAIIAQKAENFLTDYPDFAGTIIDSSWGTLKEAGEEIGLKDSEGNLVEIFTYLAAPDSSLERADPTLADYTENNWWQHSSEGTAGMQNSNYMGLPPEPEPEPEPEPAPSPTDVVTPSAPQFFPSDVVINEFVSDPADEDVEWLELYNNTFSPIDLDEWKIEEGSETKTTLSGTIDSKSFLIIEKPKGNLNNKGDIIILYGPEEQIIDQVVYGDWDDGNLSDNAPVIPDPNSVARIIDGQDTNLDSQDFQITTTPTKGEANIITQEPEEVTPVYSQDVILNELLPNPIGSDRELEFIELKNQSSADIDLTGWKIGDNSKRKYIIKDKIIPANGFLVLPRTETKLALNNSGGDTVTLYFPDETIADKISYSQKAPEDQSYARGEFGDWLWTMEITQGTENIIKQPNQPPQANINAPNQTQVGESITVDASDSFDPEGDKLIYLWDFGDGITGNLEITRHTYKTKGNYEIKLTVIDSENASSTARVLIEVFSTSTPAELPPTPSTSPTPPPAPPLYPSIPSIIISEFLPNPEGSDEKEFIELFNNGFDLIDLSSWKLDDIDGGSKPFKIPKGTNILPGQYLVFYKTQTKIALNNTYDSVRLIDLDDEIMDQVDYSNVIEGACYALNNFDQWSWTTEITPGQPNAFIQPTVKTSKVKQAIVTTLEKVREQDLGDKVRVKGVVAVEPGVLGSQVFYLAGSGIQIYMYKKDFPELQIGDYIEVTGTLSQAGGETRIKISQKEDIKILQYQKPPEAKEVEINDIGEDLEGSLITIFGEVTEIRGSNVFLDDGTEEVRIYIKEGTGIKKEFDEGSFLTVTGIVSQTRSGYRLLPRFQDDIIVGEVLGEALEEGIEISATGQQSEVVKYLTATIVALIIILIGLVIKIIRIKRTTHIY